MTTEIEKQSLFIEIKNGDDESVNGGYYVGPDRRNIAEQLVDDGRVVRFQNPAGVTPLYVPMDSDNYSEDRLERMKERQAND